MTSPAFDLAINGGLFFDGTGAPKRVVSLGVRDGKLTELRESPYSAGEARETIDATGPWITPGFVDLHTHYGAELEAAPALSESLRHKVTTLLVGSCSLGTVLSSPLNIADMFTRVEAVPREHVLPVSETKKSWNTPTEYRAHLDSLPPPPLPQGGVHRTPESRSARPGVPPRLDAGGGWMPYPRPMRWDAWQQVADLHLPEPYGSGSVRSAQGQHSLGGVGAV